MWLLPFSIVVVTLIVAIPMSKYIAWIMDGKYRPWECTRN
jgi:K+-transporting ATPase ATPase A chain